MTSGQPEGYREVVFTFDGGAGVVTRTSTRPARPCSHCGAAGAFWRYESQMAGLIEIEGIYCSIRCYERASKLRDTASTNPPAAR